MAASPRRLRELPPVMSRAACLTPSGRCGYKTFSLYPFYGAFLGSRGFQTSAGIERYLDMKDLGTRGLERDSFYFDQATNIIAREHRSGPLFSVRLHGRQPLSRGTSHFVPSSRRTGVLSVTPEYRRIHTTADFECAGLFSAARSPEAGLSD